MGFTSLLLLLLLIPLILLVVQKTMGTPARDLECQNLHPFCAVVSETVSTKRCQNFPSVADLCAASCGRCVGAHEKHVQQTSTLTALKTKTVQHTIKKTIKSKSQNKTAMKSASVNQKGFTLPPIGSRRNQLSWLYSIFRKPKTIKNQNLTRTDRRGVQEFISIVNRIAQSPEPLAEATQYLLRSLLTLSNLTSSDASRTMKSVLSPSMFNFDPPPPKEALDQKSLASKDASDQNEGASKDAIPNTLFSAYDRPDALISLSDIFKDKPDFLRELVNIVQQEILLPQRKVAEKMLELKKLSLENPNYHSAVFDSFNAGVKFPSKHFATRRITQRDIEIIELFNEHWQNNSALQGLWRESYKMRLKSPLDSHTLDRLMTLNASETLHNVLSGAAVIENSFLDNAYANSTTNITDGLLAPVIISTRIRSTFLLGPFTIVRGLPRKQRRSGESGTGSEFGHGTESGHGAESGPATASESGHGSEEVVVVEEASEEEEGPGFEILEPAVLDPAVLDPAIGINIILSPAILSPEAITAQILSPAVLSPLILSPVVVAPIVLSPAVLGPCILSPYAVSPAILAPFVLSPNILCPNVLAPLVLDPYALSPQILSPNFLSAVILSPSVLSNKILSPEGEYNIILSPLLYGDGTCDYC